MPGPDELKGRLVGAAPVNGDHAPVGEPAAGGRRQQIGRVAGYRLYEGPLPADVGECVPKPRRVRMGRAERGLAWREDGRRRAGLDDFPCVHHVF